MSPLLARGGRWARWQSGKAAGGRWGITRNEIEGCLGRQELTASQTREAIYSHVGDFISHVMGKLWEGGTIFECVEETKSALVLVNIPALATMENGLGGDEARTDTGRPEG